MTIETRKIEFVQEFLKIDNPKLLSKLENILKGKEEKVIDMPEKMTVAEFRERINQSLDDSKNGRVKSANDFKAEMETWK